jgi:hypothetical protein
MSMMKKLLFALLLMQVSAVAMAQDKTLLISESGLPYTGQTWFAYGSENIDQKDIVDCWGQGKRIVTAAYTGEGWFVIMAGNTPYSMQTYLVSEDWPEAWIAQKMQEGYAITSLSRSHSQWLVVLSQGSGITRQIIWQNTWDNLAPWIAEQKGYGYCITDFAFDGKQWLVVMSQNSKFVSQGYFTSDTNNDMMRSIQSEVWSKGFNLHQVAYGGGKFIVTFGNYAYGDERFQNLQVNPDNPKDYIREQWERGICIAYIGGGIVTPAKR